MAGQHALGPLPALPLQQVPHVVVQLVNGLGRCWTSSFSAPAARNDAGMFKGVGGPS